MNSRKRKQIYNNRKLSVSGYGEKGEDREGQEELWGNRYFWIVATVLWMYTCQNLTHFILYM